MKKIYYVCLVGMLSFANLIGAESAAQHAPQKASECTTEFLKTIGGESVSVSLENGQVKLSGSKGDIAKVIHVLTTPKELSQYFPLATGVFPQPQEGPVTSWVDFMTRLAIPLEQFSSFNQSVVSQDNGQFIAFSPKNDFENSVINMFVETVAK